MVLDLIDGPESQVSRRDGFLADGRKTRYRNEKSPGGELQHLQGRLGLGHAKLNSNVNDIIKALFTHRSNFINICLIK